MKITVFNGSPKRDKSDVMHITRAFLEGMSEAAEQDIEVVHVIDKHIEYCRGCFTCMRGDRGCVIDDDMRGLLEKMLESDLLVFSFPLYCYGMPAPLKAMIDRILPLSSMAMRNTGEGYAHVGRADYSRLKYLMVCGCGFPNSRHNFEPAVMQFKQLFPGDRTIITVPESPMFGEPSAAEATVPRLALVKQAGRQYAETGEIAPELMAAITSPMIPEEVYASIVNAGV